MISKYTTEEKIGRKLKGRLSLVDVALGLGIPGYSATVTGQVVDNALLVEIIEQEEAFIDLCLGQFYRVPLNLTSETSRNILTQIADGMIVSSLLQIHFEGTSPMNGAADTGNMIGDMRRKAELLLAKVTGGSNIFNSVMPAPMQNNYGMPEIQPLVLPGEVFLTRGQRPDLISKNYTETEINDKAQKYRKDFIFSVRGDHLSPRDLESNSRQSFYD